MLHALLGAVLIAVAAPAPGAAGEDPEAAKALAKYKASIDKGLEWLAKEQHKDGHWEALQGQYPISMTALAGLALLSEGSTWREGKYSGEIGRAVKFLLGQQQKNGLIGLPPGNNLQRPPNFQAVGDARYMFGHGFATLFLAQVIARETDREKKLELSKAVEEAVKFLADSQTTLGGWGYVSAKDGGDFDEGAATICQIHALLAAKNAGVAVPKDLVEKAQTYLIKSSKVAVPNDDKVKIESGVVYSLKQGGGGTVRSALTAGGLTCLFAAGEGESELATQWLNYCQKQIAEQALLRPNSGYAEYQQFYFAQVVYKLGEDRHAKLRPDLAKLEEQREKKDQLLRWGRYRDALLDALAKEQAADGSWSGKGAYVGPVYQTSLYLIIMQLDKAHLPICRR